MSLQIGRFLKGSSISSSVKLSASKDGLIRLPIFLVGCRGFVQLELQLPDHRIAAQTQLINDGNERPLDWSSDAAIKSSPWTSAMSTALASELFRINIASRRTKGLKARPAVGHSEWHSDFAL